MTGGGLERPGRVGPDGEPRRVAANGGERP